MYVCGRENQRNRGQTCGMTFLERQQITVSHILSNKLFTDSWTVDCHMQMMLKRSCSSLLSPMLIDRRLFSNCSLNECGVFPISRPCQAVGCLPFCRTVQKQIAHNQGRPRQHSDVFLSFLFVFCLYALTPFLMTIYFLAIITLTEAVVREGQDNHSIFTFLKNIQSN